MAKGRVRERGADGAGLGGGSQLLGSRVQGGIQEGGLQVGRGMETPLLWVKRSYQPTRPFLADYSFSQRQCWGSTLLAAAERWSWASEEEQSRKYYPEPASRQL